MQWWLLDNFDLFVSQSTISRALKGVKWRKKTNGLVATQRDHLVRADWIVRIQEYRADQFVFIDESGVDKRDGLRRTGWAPKGIKPKKLVPGGGKDRGVRHQVLPALTINGILGLSVYEGSTDGQGFVDYIEGVILPKTSPFPGPNSVLVMDNASFHFHDDLKRLCDEAGVRLEYLPTYSPDLNPIEAFFGDLKKYIRRHFQYHEDQWRTGEDWQQFLTDCVYEVAQNNKAIRGHFRKAMVPEP